LVEGKSALVTRGRIRVTSATYNIDGGYSAA
jgi:hypothetical protein